MPSNTLHWNLDFKSELLQDNHLNKSYNFKELSFSTEKDHYICIWYKNRHLITLSTSKKIIHLINKSSMTLVDEYISKAKDTKFIDINNQEWSISKGYLIGEDNRYHLNGLRLENINGATLILNYGKKITTFESSDIKIDLLTAKDISLKSTYLKLNPQKKSMKLALDSITTEIKDGAVGISIVLDIIALLSLLGGVLMVLNGNPLIWCLLSIVQAAILHGFSKALNLLYRIKLNTEIYRK